jgi:hypothetical protein
MEESPFKAEEPSGPAYLHDTIREWQRETTHAA